MELAAYLQETFLYNSFANKKVLEKIRLLPDPQPCIRLFSHLINCQYKWLNRISIYPEISTLDWWAPEYPIDKLEAEWDKSLQGWLDFLANTSEEALHAPVKWIGIQNKPYTAALKDIPLQLNYHSIHHRAQMQSIIRAQGLEPDFVDYIGTKYKPLE